MSIVVLAREWRICEIFEEHFKPAFLKMVRRHFPGASVKLEAKK